MGVWHGWFAETSLQQDLIKSPSWTENKTSTVYQQQKWTMGDFNDPKCTNKHTLAWLNIKKWKTLDLVKASKMG